MENAPILDARLLTIAGFVRENAVVADIGTDHGYLMAYLAHSNKIKKGYACDINAEPLNKAKATMEKYNVNEKVECVLTDGLINLPLMEIDDIIIAGLGGDAILNIIKNADFSKKNKRFILQPMTKFDRLREGLLQIGIEILFEEPVISGKFVYTLMICEFTNKTKKCDIIYKHLGEILKSQNRDKYLYLKRIRNNLSERIDGLINSGAYEKEIADYEKVIKIIDESLVENDDNQ